MAAMQTVHLETIMDVLQLLLTSTQFLDFVPQPVQRDSSPIRHPSLASAAIMRAEHAQTV